jgi:hypothetical protein
MNAVTYIDPVGMIIFMVLARFGAIYYLRSQRKADS